MFQILIVEDDKNTRRLMSAILTRYGYEPLTACNGERALTNAVGSNYLTDNALFIRNGLCLYYFKHFTAKICECTGNGRYASYHKVKLTGGS